MTNTPPPKVLTHDEKKAAEAAFAGRPFNEAWSAAARTVYDGIVKAMPHKGEDDTITIPAASEPLGDAVIAQPSPLQTEEPPIQGHSGGQELVEEST
ncbi:MAG: hypothetical protein OEV08_14555 [Nitrospira sp.]|nr:hypothetical protein [Nitrospira sp.]